MYQPKSGFLTFCLAFMPGAGQMYQGYMKRGVSLCALFFATIWLTDILSSLMVLVPIVWMYSFFDTLNLRSQLLAGVAVPDDYLFRGDSGMFSRWTLRGHALLGWLLIAVGVYALYENVLMRFLNSLLQALDGGWFIYDMLERLPGLVLTAGLIALGVWLVRGPRPAPAPGDEDIHHYQGGAEHGDGNGTAQ